jgi:hypothetical protein
LEVRKRRAELAGLLWTTLAQIMCRTVLDLTLFLPQVEKSHTYFVASGSDNHPLLVHNSNCAPDALTLTNRPHVGAAHDNAIMDRLSELGDGVKDVRKDQAQVNNAKKKVSDFRPDGQWTDENGVRHLLQIIDSNPTTRALEMLNADPKAVMEILF